METGIGSPNNPSPNHFAALERAERERRKSEASRMLLTAPPPGSDLAALAELLKNPQAVAKRVADLAEATRKNNEAAVSAQRATEKLQRAEQGLAQHKEDSAAEIERSRAEHAAWLLKERSEIEHEKAAVAQLKVAVEADAKKAAELKNEMTRRLRAMEGV